MKFTKTQYEHIKTLFSNLLENVEDAVGMKPPKEPTYEECAGMINDGTAKLNLERLFGSSGGSCPYRFRDALMYFDFPGADEREAKNIAAQEHNTAIRAKLSHYLQGMLDRYVVGAMSPDDLLAKVAELGEMPDEELAKFVNNLKRSRLDPGGGDIKRRVWR
jgi:hypothetical protein